jgi:hypothetical protein
MGLLEDVRKILADIPLWKELGTLPDRTKLLEQRVAELEAKLNGKYPADVCPRCGERTMRATASSGQTSHCGSGDGPGRACLAGRV